MAEFNVNTHRFDPYKAYNFRVKWDGVYVAGVSKVSTLKRTTEPVLHRNGGDPSHERKSPGKTTYDAVTLERGVTHSPEFEAWANLVHSLESPMSLRNFRKDIILDVYNEADQKVLSYQLLRCWPSEYAPLPQLDAGTAGVAIETLKLEVESWQRDVSVTEPSET
jgi:phage tail-like protein